ncbi:MAG: response regulator [Elusimicrobiales bacterium]
MPKKILVVEDDLQVAELLVSNLESLNCKVLVAYDGETGWELAQKEQPDLVIQDLGLPNMDGFALCKLIKNKSTTRHARVIMLTGKTLVGDMENAFQGGADAYVNKPFVWDRMLQHIRKLLGPEIG